jgi:hypothetical protein
MKEVLTPAVHRVHHMFMHAFIDQHMHPCTPQNPSQPPLPPLQGLLQRLGPIAAAAAIFLGGYGTGLASSNMYADIQAAEKTLVSQALLAPQAPVRQASLTMPDKVQCTVHTLAAVLI